MKKRHMILSIFCIIVPPITLVLLITYPTQNNSLIYLGTFLITSLYQGWFIRKYNINITRKRR
jgi:hypothetical protein